MEREYALVLAGGGARGSYQLGVWKALRELGVKITAVTGTSVGALNGAMIAMDDYESAYDLWYNMDITSVIKGDEDLICELKDTGKKSFNRTIKSFRNVMNSGGLDVTPLEETLRSKIDESRVRKSDIEFGLVTVEVDNWKPLEVFVEDIPEGRLHEYLMASSSLPVFKVEGDKRKFLDGCFHDNMPIELIAKKGHKKIIAVDLGAFGVKKNIKDPQLEITYIQPSDSLGKGLEFNKSASRRNIDMGYYDTMKKMKGLYGSRYYFNNCHTEDETMRRLLSLPEKLVLQLGALLGFEGIPYRRMLFEKILPKIGELIGCSKNYDYSELIMKLYEFIGDQLKIKRLEIYDYNHFRKIVEFEVSDKQGINKQLRDAPRFLKQSNMFKWSVKADLMKLILGEIVQYEKSQCEENKNTILLT